MSFKKGDLIKFASPPESAFGRSKGFKVGDVGLVTEVVNSDRMYVLFYRHAQTYGEDPEHGWNPNWPGWALVRRASDVEP